LKFIIHKRPKDHDEEITDTEIVLLYDGENY